MNACNAEITVVLAKQFGVEIEVELKVEVEVSAGVVYHQPLCKRSKNATAVVAFVGISASSLLLQR